MTLKQLLVTSCLIGGVMAISTNMGAMEKSSSEDSEDKRSRKGKEEKKKKEKKAKKNKKEKKEKGKKEGKKKKVEKSEERNEENKEEEDFIKTIENSKITHKEELEKQEKKDKKEAKKLKKKEKKAQKEYQYDIETQRAIELSLKGNSEENSEKEEEADKSPIVLRNNEFKPSIPFKVQTGNKETIIKPIGKHRQEEEENYQYDNKGLSKPMNCLGDLKLSEIHTEIYNKTDNQIEFYFNYILKESSLCFYKNPQDNKIKVVIPPSKHIVFTPTYNNHSIYSIVSITVPPIHTNSTKGESFVKNFKLPIENVELKSLRNIKIEEDFKATILPRPYTSGSSIILVLPKKESKK